MNFALVAVLFLFLSLPGIAFRRGYFSSRFSISYISTNSINEIVWSLIPAYALHSLSFWLIEAYLGHDIKLEYIGYLLAGGNNIKYIDKIFSNFNSHILDILNYNLSMCTFAWLSGNLLRIFIRSFCLDIYFKPLRYPNRWHYLFTGEYKMTDRDTSGLGEAFKYLKKLNISKANKAWKIHKNFAFITIDVLCNIGNENILYSGKFEDYYLANHGGLDRILIKFPAKKEFSSNSEGEFIEIPSDYLIIPYSNITNINISYIEIETEDTVQSNIIIE